jgi:exodeoxyribonuclease-3
LHVLTGDFNTLAPGELLEHQRLPPRLRLIAWATGGRVRYKTIQNMLDAGYTDGYRTLHTDPGYTFPTWDPHVRLDFVFTPNEFSKKIGSCGVVTDGSFVRQASDHFPLLSTIDA